MVGKRAATRRQHLRGHGGGGWRVASGLSRSLPCFGVDNRGVSPALAALRINRAGPEPGLRHL